MVGVGDGEVYFRVGSGDGPGPSANTAVALSSNEIITLSQISDLWVECAFMGVSPVFIAALSAEHSCLLKMFLQEKSFLMKYFSRWLHID
jgi:hypothetical protein